MKNGFLTLALLVAGFAVIAPAPANAQNFFDDLTNIIRVPDDLFRVICDPGPCQPPLSDGPCGIAGCLPLPKPIPMPPPPSGAAYYLVLLHESQMREAMLRIELDEIKARLRALAGGVLETVEPREARPDEEK